MLYKINDPNFIKLVEKEIPLDRLEQRLRPKLGLEDSDAEYKAHDNYRDFSGEGFLGKDESLLEVIHSDWQILSKYKTTHAEIANALEKVVAGDYALHPDYEFRDDGMASLGTQGCPWYCGVLKTLQQHVAPLSICWLKRPQHREAYFCFLLTGP